MDGRGSRAAEPDRRLGKELAVHSGDVVLAEDDLFLPGELLVDLGDDELEVAVVGHIVEVVGRDGEDGAEGEVLDPLFVQVVQACQVVGANLLLVFPSAQGDPAAEGEGRGAQIDDEIGRRQEHGEHPIQLLVGAPVAVGDVPLEIEIPGKDLGVFVDGSVLDYRGGGGAKLAGGGAPAGGGEGV